mmetsp:Transcript_45176/g.83596  ORF Transcript_45176/g.83596 Transcript_45176/m.83596 type:complete len:233 (-) Transcript_45176:76-774(-)|eukprot:CAMPEP_0197451328 /NCGR_PEP_ID=MMETSP1175-20131217/28469_1 /TAXON_ID=1003142 /ORGANISM="Triceratium dubium, Strain CCMP147" /LENGTH=232 /DNA_ID=CAMNT_0042984007 /DNA_START=228 /DNA_END=926 /DNA_ORIENTATION=+
MGIVFGKTGVAEPAYDVLLSRTAKSGIKVPYEIRRYGERFAAETPYIGEDGINSAFRRLAGYIGVGGPAQNEGGTSIAMTAPVVTDASGGKKGEKIAMTAPVVIKAVEEKEGESGGEKKKMQFILPASYDDLSKIPKPTNSNVTIAAVPPSVGAVHAFDAWVKEDKAREKVSLLVGQLKEDGLDVKEEDALKTYLLWQYNPPFTIPQFRRNEVWIELSEENAKEHAERFQKE